jgi:hypothetical protein
MEKQAEIVEPTLKELLLSDSDRFDLEIPTRGNVNCRRADATTLFGEINAETDYDSDSESFGVKIVNPFA